MLLCSTNAWSTNVDSLESILSNSKDIELKQEALSRIMAHYQGQGNQAKAIDIANQYLYQFKDDTREKCVLYLSIADNYADLHNSEKAQEFYNTCISVAQKNMFHKERYSGQRFLAYHYLSEGDFSEGLNLFNSNLDLATAHISEDSSYIMNAYNDIGSVYYYTADYNNCALNWEKNLSYAARNGDLSSEASSLSNLGLVYISLEKNDKAEKYLKRAILLSDSLELTANLMNAYTNLGKLYFHKKDYVKAENYLLEAQKIVEKSGDIKSTINGLNNLGEVLIKNRQYENGKKYIEQAIELSEQYGLIDYKSNALYNLADYYSERKDFATAYELLDSVLGLKDSFLSAEKIRQISELETKYKLKQKEDSLQLSIQGIKLSKAKQDLAEENEQKALEKSKKDRLQSEQDRLLLLGSLILLCLAGGLIFIVVRNNRHRKKANLILASQKKIIEQRNKDITDSIEYAKNLQTAILPDIDLIKEVVPNYVLLYEPRDIVSGDFYWFHESEDKVFLAAADCTGHGVPGAFVSMLCNDALNKVVITLGFRSPGEILSKVNQTVIEAFRKEGASHQAYDGMDVTLCVLDKKTRNLTFSGAMNRLIIIRNQEVIEYKGNKSPIGGRTPMDYQFDTQFIETQTKDAVYMFSDGYIDQFGGDKGKKFMVKRMKKMLLEINHLKADEQKIEMKQRLLDWQGHYDRIDDVLVIGFEI